MYPPLFSEPKEYFSSFGYIHIDYADWRIVSYAPRFQTYSVLFYDSSEMAKQNQAEKCRIDICDISLLQKGLIFAMMIAVKWSLTFLWQSRVILSLNY